MECHECKRTDEETHLERCAICFKYYCEEHCYSWSNRTFCSKPCAEYFFFGDSDEED